MTATVTKRRARSGRSGGAPAERPPRRLPGKVIAALLAVLAAAAAAVVWYSPVLGLESVQVTGAGTRQLAGEIRSAVAIETGTPLAGIDTADVAARVDRVGPVASATVRRDWPHTLIVTVTTRTPVATTQANGRWWLIDKSGEPYQAVDTRPAGLMPVRLATPGEGDRATMAALGVLASLPDSIRADVTAIAAPTAYDVSLLLADGRTVIWGSDSEAALKARVLPALLEQPGTTYDISDPTLATVR